MDYYSPPSEKVLNQKKLEEYTKFSKIINWGRANPIRFVESFFGIALLDYQAWAFMESWCKPYVMWLECRGAGKTAKAAVFLQAKMMLIPDYKVFISALTARQSIDTFKKLEDIALQRIPQFMTCTDLFSREVEKTANSDTGFLHNPAENKCKLYNNSELITLSSNVNAIRGKRGSVMYDETAWQNAEIFAATESYINVDSSWGLGVGEKEIYNPKKMPLQLMYASSAGDSSYPFFDKFKTYSKKMIAGDSNYFVCDLDANTVFNNSSMKGKKIKSYITEEQIAKIIADDADLADRELFNHFRKGAGHNAVVKMDTLIKNSTVRPPMLYNTTGKKKFIFVYDPARSYDGSILAIFELLDDKEKGLNLKLQNVISMVDTETNKKTPLPMTEQLKIIKKTMLKYNGERAAEWESLEFFIDAGAGGGGLSGVADQLMEDWDDEIGKKHRGIIDPEHKQYETSRKKYVNAVEIVHLVEPAGYKKIMFDALEKMTKADLIDFPDYDGKEFLVLMDEKTGEFYNYPLSDEEILSLTQCNLMKNEAIYMCRYDTPNGGISYDLVKDKKNKMHDDRAYCLAMGAYALALLRRTELLAKPKDNNNVATKLQFRAPVIRK
jgi:hypothetical protein